jgi:Spy/CpxP family protein refolding chaperone
MRKGEDMKNRVILWLGLAMIVAAGLAIVSASIAQARVFQGRPGMAQGPGGGRGPGGPRGGGPGLPFAQLDLTEEQKTQIKALHEKARTDSETYHEQLKPVRESLRTAIESSTFDEAAVRALLVKEAQLMTELNVIRTRTENAVYNLLTAEQKTKLAELRAHHGPRRGGKPHLMR